MKRELTLMEAKTEALNSAKQIEQLYTEAIQAMRRYSGAEEVDDD